MQLQMWMNLPPYPNLCKAKKKKKETTPRILQKDFYSVYFTHQLWHFLSPFTYGQGCIQDLNLSSVFSVPSRCSKEHLGLDVLRNWVAFTIWGKVWSTENGVQAKPEFVYQNCVKLIGHGGTHKHSCTLKPLFIQNTSSITNYLLTSLTTYYEVKN